MALLCRAEHWPRLIRLHRLATTSANSLHLIDPGHGVRLTRVEDHNRAPSSTSLFCSPGRPKYTLRFVPMGSLRERFLKQRKSTSPIIRWSVRHGSDGLLSVKTFRERDWVQFFWQGHFIKQTRMPLLSALRWLSSMRLTTEPCRFYQAHAFIKLPESMRLISPCGRLWNSRFLSEPWDKWRCSGPA
jgi:hypothetical protein